MNILVIGGSGLLGSHIAREALRRGHTVTVLSRGAIEGKLDAEDGIRHIRADVYALSTEEIDRAFSGQDAVAYALGIDDRHTHERPAYPLFHADHVDVCLRALKSAKEHGARKFLALGSYFTYFDAILPELNLASEHIYIRTRKEQKEAVLKETCPGFDTFILELPYILGTLEGKVPPWTFIFSMLAGRGKRSLFFTKGGTAAVTAVQVGQAAIGAIERGIGGTAYPLGGKNYAWTDFAKAYFNVTKKAKSLVSLPPAVFRAFGIASSLFLGLRGRERGLDIGKFTDFQYMAAYIDPKNSMAALGYGPDDYDAALSNVIDEWIAIRENRISSANHASSVVTEPREKAGGSA